MSSGTCLTYLYYLRIDIASYKYQMFT